MLFVHVTQIVMTSHYFVIFCTRHHLIMTSHNFCPCQHKLIIWHLLFLFPESGFNARILNIQQRWILVCFPLEFYHKCNSHCISIFVSIPHWNFITIANKLRFHNLSLFHLGILSSSPINCLSTIGLYSTLEFHHRHQ